VIGGLIFCLNHELANRAKVIAFEFMKFSLLNVMLFKISLSLNLNLLGIKLISNIINNTRFRILISYSSSDDNCLWLMLLQLHKC
jgi:hypothetical protein